MPEPLQETISKSKLNICSWPVRKCGYCGTQTKLTLGLGQQYLISVRDKSGKKIKKMHYHLTQPKALIQCNVQL